MNPNGVNGDSNGQNINTNWFTEGVGDNLKIMKMWQFLTVFEVEYSSDIKLYVLFYYSTFIVVKNNCI